MLKGNRDMGMDSKEEENRGGRKKAVIMIVNAMALGCDCYD